MSNPPRSECTSLHVLMTAYLPASWEVEVIQGGPDRTGNESNSGVRHTSQEGHRQDAAASIYIQTETEPHSYDD